MSNIQNRQHMNSRVNALRRVAQVLLLLSMVLTTPAALATETMKVDTNSASKEMLSVEQESASNVAPNNPDSRDDLEPSTLALLALGLIALGLVRRKVRE